MIKRSVITAFCSCMIITASCNPAQPPYVAPEDLISSEPEITLPGGYNSDDIVITESLMDRPERINTHFILTGRIYDISLQGRENVDFGSEYAELTFTYDKTKLSNKEMLEDFILFYYDAGDDKWKPVEMTQVDTENARVRAYTSHFTPFVLTAVPSASGTVADPPSCISADFPFGIGGTGSAVFTIVDENFKYYRDRDYFIRDASISATNALTLTDLGLRGALGISTVNGNSPLGPFSEHKQYTGDDYIVFTAHRDLDVYLMYDTRGGTDIYDTSQDAPWIASSGFVNTGYFIETTDAVTYYTVYKKSYNQDETVQLHGNRKGVTDFSIDTNYWLILKIRDDTSDGCASDLCVASPDTSPPDQVTNLKAVPGSTTITLTWQNPDNPDFAGVVIRRSTVLPPSGIADGDEPTGTVISPQCYLDSGLTQGSTYYFTVFSLDQNNNYVPGESVTVVTSIDSDGDGISDIYENSTLYPTGLYSDPADIDTDGDGINDGVEIQNGTDPTNGDTVPPVVDTFVLTDGSPTCRFLVPFTMSGTDNIAITGWMATITDTPPLPDNTNWTALPPADYLFSDTGSYTLYAWAVDAAGNVSAGFGVPLVIEPSVSGYVRDSFGTPVEGALVRLYNGSFSEYTVSGIDGYYEFADVPAGTYYLVATRDNYTLVTMTITIP